MQPVLATLFHLKIPQGQVAFGGALTIASLLLALYKMKGFTSPYLGNQHMIALLTAVSVGGILAGLLLGLGAEPEGLWRDLLRGLFVIGLTSAFLLIATRILGIVIKALRQSRGC